MGIEIPRAQWGAKFGRGGVIGGGLGLVVVHHAATPDLATTATPAQEVEAIRGIERYHGSPKPDGKGWAGIAYSFLVCPSGRVYEGRGWRREGAHTEGKNRIAYGICFVQNGGTRALTDQSIRATQALLAEGVDGGHLALGYEIDGHRDHSSTDCPGGLIYPRLAELRPGAPADTLDRAAEIRAALEVIEAQLARVRAVL